MRVMLKATLDTEKSSEAIREGKLAELIKSTMDTIKPEAAYFMPDEGQRSCVFVFDMQDSSDLPSLAEPFFLQLGAKVEVSPVMNLDDLQKGLSQLG
ncbi:MULTISPECIES: DUF3303 family protein [Streptomyces aurantiacus group]|uniref:Uncharacterized protein n=1 Tax=Streptomyces flaveus TaxID=66370 RepID=A0A917R9Y6_9ACTN|nr:MULTISPECIES: DUF3303 family protein [Streptomyces]GGK97833.1 hypothetical protein GCM10010094_68440 [Streptomyces flaveus]